MTRLRVLVVEDSVTVRKRLCEVLASDPELQVVGEADNGELAIELCRALRPDVLTMDMMLPRMTGLAATEYIMAHFPTPILVVSSSFNRGELFRTYDALAAGAVDVLDKPGGHEAEGDWEQRLISSVKVVARIRVITHLRARMNARVATLPAPGRPWCKLIAIGASTGGPRAVVDVLRALPSPLSVPVLLVLHINEPFGTAFADWLATQTPHRVACAQDGETLAAAAGRVLTAPPGRHLVLSQGCLRLMFEPERHSCRPSIDRLFESLAVERGAATAACLLTGMGRDGAAGLLDIRRAGGLTIAQDEATSVIYGMPREAVLIGAAERVLPLDEIGPALAAATTPGWEAQT
jgi:two-component system chemotaxis response regulator CheB